MGLAIFQTAGVVQLFRSKRERYGHFISYVPGLDGVRFEFAYG